MIFRPFTPPCALTYLKYASAPRPTEPKSAAGPVIGTVPPIVIVLAVTPGEPPASATGARQQAAADREQRALHPLIGSVSVCNVRIAGPSEIEPRSPKPRYARSGPPSPPKRTRQARALREVLHVVREPDRLQPDLRHDRAVGDDAIPCEHDRDEPRVVRELAHLHLEQRGSERLQSAAGTSGLCAAARCRGTRRRRSSSSAGRRTRCACCLSPRRS